LDEKRVLAIHRKYRHKGGEDFFIADFLLPALGLSKCRYDALKFGPLFSNFVYFFQDVLEVICMGLGLEFFRPSLKAIRRRIEAYKPTHVIFNNFIPTLSLNAPALAKAHGAKTIYWIHNSRLYCANGLSFNGKKLAPQGGDGEVKTLTFNPEGLVSTPGRPKPAGPQG